MSGLYANAKAVGTLAWRVVVKLVFVLILVPRNLVLGMLNRAGGINRATGGYSKLQSQSQSPAGEQSRHYVERFESLYGAEHVPMVAGASFLELSRRAKREAKYLIALFENEEHDSSRYFNTNVLCAPELAELLRDERYIVWAGDTGMSDAFQAAYQINCSKLPCIAVLAPVKADSANLNLILRLQGTNATTSLPRIMQALMQITQRHEPELRRQRGIVQERETARRLREEQDQAYAESLRRDRERRLQAEQRQAALLEAQQRAALAVVYKAAWRQQQRQQQLPIDREGSARPARLNVRSSGRRVLTVCSDASLYELYMWVDCSLNEAQDAERLSSASDVHIPDDYVHEFDFDLYSPMPRERIPSSMDTKIADVPSIYPSGTVVVEEKEDEEEVDD